MATFKHISSKNADYSAAEAYLTFEHDEFTMRATLDENGRLIPREDYRISTLNCGDEDFAISCMRANLRYGKNQKREDVKSHHYIISFDPKDVPDHGLTVDMAQNWEINSVPSISPDIRLLSVPIRAGTAIVETFMYTSLSIPCELPKFRSCPIWTDLATPSRE